MQITKVRISGFKNLENVSIELKDIQLLIGPNNSGKSNLLKALQMVSYALYLKFIQKPKYENFLHANHSAIYDSFQKLQQSISEKCKIELNWEMDKYPDYFLYLSLFIEKNNFYFEVGLFNKKEILKEDDPKRQFDLPYSPLLLEGDEKFSQETYFDLGNSSIIFQEESEISSVLEYIKNYFFQFVNLPIYELYPKKMGQVYGTTGDAYLESDGSNLLSFLDEMQGTYKEVFHHIEADIKKFTDHFDDIRFETIRNPTSELKTKFPNSTIKRFGLKDKWGNLIWSDSLSDGVLYFLGILCIIHQPSPPAILILEEPEKGIHPRRIREVINLLFTLVEEKKIQIILTTHSVFLVNEFSSYPENVSVFDIKEGKVFIRNLKRDVLDKLNEDFIKNGFEPEEWKNLGEDWALGLLGGVPD